MQTYDNFDQHPRGEGGPERTNTIFSKSKEEVSMKDFRIIKVLGKGSFGKVFLVEKLVGK
jgi:serine/threonine protein kinase